MTDKKETIYSALFAVQGALQGVGKDKNNSHFKTSYATLMAVTDTIKPAMQKNNLLWMHYPEPNNDNMSVIITTKIVHVPTGEAIETSLRVPLQKPDAQKIGSAMTYAMRYTLMALLGLAPKDDDGNAATKGQHDAAPQQSKATSRDEFQQIVETIRGASTEQELRGYWARVPWHDMPKDWIGEIFREKDERLATINSAKSQSPADSLDEQFPGDMPFDGDKE